jgi:hypothetical protein
VLRPTPLRVKSGYNSAALVNDSVSGTPTGGDEMQVRVASPSCSVVSH